MTQFDSFLKVYRRRIDEESGEPPTNISGGSVATTPGGMAPTFTRKMTHGKPHYTVDDHVYRAIRKGKKKYSRWDRFIQNDSELCAAMRQCMGEFGQVTVESKISGQMTRLKK